MELNEIIIQAIAFITLLGGWYFDRKKLNSQLKQSQSETTASDLGNISKNFEVYQSIINDLELRFKTRILELEEDLSKIKVLNEELRKVISDQEKYIKKLQKNLDKYEKLEG